MQSPVGDADRTFLQAPLTTHDSDMWAEPSPEWGLPPSLVLQVANLLWGLMQACYNWVEKVHTVLNEAGALPFETELRTFVFVRRGPRGH